MRDISLVLLLGCGLCSLPLVGCKSNDKPQVGNQGGNQGGNQASNQTAQKAANKVEAVEATPPTLPEGPIELKRSYVAGQTYSLKFTRADSRLKTSYLATVEVLSGSGENGVIGIDILSIDEELAGQPARSTPVNVKVKVAIEDGSHDATVVSSSTDHPAAGDLTAFEMMAGDLCQPPSSKHEQSEEWKDGELAFKFGGVSIVDDLVQLSYDEVQARDGFASSCHASVALVDGYAGQREITTTMNLGPGLPPSEQVQTLSIRRL